MDKKILIGLAFVFIMLASVTSVYGDTIIKQEIGYVADCLMFDKPMFIGGLLGNTTISDNGNINATGNFTGDYLKGKVRSEHLVNYDMVDTWGDGSSADYRYNSNQPYRLTQAHKGTGSDQNGYILYQWVVPEGFVNFENISLETFRDGDSDSFTLDMYSNHSVDETINGSNIRPDSNVTFTTFSFVPSSSYSANDVIIFYMNSTVDSGEYNEFSYMRIIYYKEVY